MKFSDRVSYCSLKALFGFLGLFPLRSLYLLSDVLAFLVDDVFRYRRRVVTDNLRSSFPEKGEEEIAGIRRRFYRFMTDCFVETVKEGSMPMEEMRRRMRFENPEALVDCCREGRSVTMLLGHYCNWEWVSSFGLYVPEGGEGGQIYHRLRNAGADRFFHRLRSRFGVRSIEMRETMKVILGWKQEGKPSIVGYIADQSPKWNSIHHWLEFLNHDTGVFTGPERISRKLHAAVFYLDISRPRRGEYVGRFIEITPDASREPELKVTEEYFRMLAESIRREPAYWLWSHKRWKRTHEEFCRLFGEGHTGRL